MKKEILIAIFVGLSMGLIITFGVYRVKNSIHNIPESNLVEKPDINKKATNTPTILALHTPEDGTIQTKKELNVAGTTTPNSLIVLFVNNDDFISNSDDSGNFSFKVNLEDGPNIIRVHVLNENGETAVEERLVVVSDAFEQAKIDTENKTSTDENLSGSTNTKDTNK